MNGFPKARLHPRSRAFVMHRKGTVMSTIRITTTQGVVVASTPQLAKAAVELVEHHAGQICIYCGGRWDDHDRLLREWEHCTAKAEFFAAQQR